METSSESTEEKGAFSWRTIILGPLLFLLVYILSIGPVVMLGHKGYLNSPRAGAWLDTIYAPLMWSAKLPVFGKVLDKYVELWDHASNTRKSP